MKFLKISIFLLFSSWLGGQSQGVSITANGAVAPDKSALLDVQSTTKGMLVPRMSSGQRTGIVNPAKGLLVFDNTTSSFWYYSNGWQELAGSGGSGGGLWSSLANNSGVYRMDGKVGVGTDDPVSMLDVRGDLTVGQKDKLANRLVFAGTPGDNQPQYREHTVIEERVYSGTEQSELLLWKGNDPTFGGVGSDRIRLDAVGGIVFQVGGENGGEVGRLYDPAVEGKTLLHLTHDGQVVFGDNLAQLSLEDIQYSGKKNGVLVLLAPDSYDVGNKKRMLMIGSDGNEINAVNEQMGKGESVLHLNYNTGGNVRVGGWDPANVSDLDVQGTVYQASDERLKTDIQPISRALATVTALSGKTYRWRGSPKRGLKYGFIAQEVAEVLPEVVSMREPDAKKGETLQSVLSISYTELIPILVEAIKEQQTQIARLQKGRPEVNPRDERVLQDSRPGINNDIELREQVRLLKEQLKVSEDQNKRQDLMMRELMERLGKVERTRPEPGVDEVKPGTIKPGVKIPANSGTGRSEKDGE